jgi:ribosomal protein S18 acetylase RimI-like enzyme
VIVPATGPREIARVRELFREYADGLGLDLSFQGFARELRELPGDYAPPRGALLLALQRGRAMGCVGVREFSGSTAEMKRLYVRAAARGLGLGRVLAEGAVSAARRLGYERLRLDTLPGMEAAQGLYGALGFREIAPYRENPVPGARFLELDL